MEGVGQRTQVALAARIVEAVVALGAEVAGQAQRDPRGEVLDVVGPRTGQRHPRRGARRRFDEHAVGQEQMKMGMKIQTERVPTDHVLLGRALAQ